MMLAAVSYGSRAQQGGKSELSLTDLSAFKSPSANWSVAGSVTSDFNKEYSLDKKNGTGVLVTIPGKKDNKDLYTVMEHGDIDLSLDFLMPKGSNSGIYLQGRYEIQLADSWGKDKLAADDLGGVYYRWDESRPAGSFGYDGVAPRLNASRAPGLWQNIRIIFRAPRFDAAGKKTENARIVKLILNGATITENAELTGPTRGSAFADEAAKGPLRIQGDHGPVAIRSITYSTDVPVKETDGADRSFSESQVFVNVGDEPALLRSFVDISENKRVTHAVNVGYPHNVSYAYDLDNGSVFQVWKGGFVDGTPMWLFRGDGNTTAIGSKLPLSDAPAIAVLADQNTTAWPDSVGPQDQFRTKGYWLDEKGYPTFKYSLNGVNVEDKLTTTDGKALDRTINLNGKASGNLYYRIAAANDITDLGKGMYSIGNYEYYVQLGSGTKAVLRSTGKGKELVIPVKDAEKGATVSYSLIW